MTLDSKALEAAHESYSTHGQTGDLRRAREAWGGEDV